ncbi:DUF2510 domain-containing protein [Streptomyces sp. NPDC006610]|uniref:DUF2510 domain-containing protein n=1 Tax=Streptomyces sp. NPDC006610 TaxID=3154584 RepID=UPI0033A09AB0
MTTPPGWYRDPHAPHVERWWDGTAWTEHRRPPEPAPPAPARPAGPARSKAVALTVAGAVLVAAIGAGAFLLGQDGGDEGGAAAATTAPPTPAEERPAPTATPSDPPQEEDPTVVVDELNGFTVPLLDGWERPENIAVDDVLMTTDGTYDCPGDPGVCRHGLVISRTVTDNDETSPEALAKGDIEDAADDAYDHDLVGGRPFGGIESHRLVASGPVAVAGRAGYYVRWRVETALGPGGYVQSLAFQSSVGTEAPVIVRYVFDAGEDGPPLADMDRITDGIRSVDGTGTGGGVGSSIGPSSD